MDKNLNQKKIFLVFLTFLSFLLYQGVENLIGSASRAQGLVESVSSARGELSTPELAGVSERPHLKNQAAPGPELTARAVLAYHQDSRKTLFSRNADQPMPVASLTKLTTALLASRSLSPDDVVTVPGAVMAIPSPNLGLLPGEQITAGSLVEGMLVASANDAAEVLAFHIGQGDRDQALLMMNSLASNIGLSRTKYANPTGFDDADAYSTASDILKVVFEIERSPWLMSVLSEPRGRVTSVDGRFTHNFQTTNRLLRGGGFVIGGKTGYTDEAKGNLVVWANAPDGSKIVAIVLGSEDREAEIITLIDWIFNAYQF